VAQSLKRPTEQVTKFIGLQMGAQSRYDPNTDRAIVNGAFTSEDLQKHVFAYIEKFVLCPNCRNPETVQGLKGKKKSALVTLTCKACGMEKEADNSHKLVTFIIKELGEDHDAATTATAPSSKKASPRPIEGDAVVEAANIADHGDGGKADAEAAPGAEKEEKKKKKDDKKKKKKKKSSEDADDGGEAKKKKKKKTEDGGEAKKKKKKKDKRGADADNDDEAPALKLREQTFIDALASLSLDAAAPADAVKAAVETALEAHGLPEADRFVVVWQALVAPAPTRATVDKHKEVLRWAADQVEGGPIVLGCVEALLGEGKIVPKTVPLLLKSLFDAEVVDDQSICGWFTGEITATQLSTAPAADALAQAKIASKPLVDWLEEDSDSEAGSDSEADSDDDDDDNKDGKKRAAAAANSSDDSDQSD